MGHLLTVGITPANGRPHDERYPVEMGKTARRVTLRSIEHADAERIVLIRGGRRGKHGRVVEMATGGENIEPTRERRVAEREHPWKIEIKLCPARSEANEISEEYGNRLGPGTEYNCAVRAMLDELGSAGVGVAIKNPHGCDGVVAMFLTLGPLVLKGALACLNTYLKGKKGRSLSVEGAGWKIKASGISAREFRKLVNDVARLDGKEGKVKETRKRKANSRTAGKK